MDSLRLIFLDQVFGTVGVSWREIEQKLPLESVHGGGGVPPRALRASPSELM